MGIAAPRCMPAAVVNLHLKACKLTRSILPGTHLVILYQDSLRTGVLLLHCSVFPITLQLHTKSLCPTLRDNRLMAARPLPGSWRLAAAEPQGNPPPWTRQPEHWSQLRRCLAEAACWWVPAEQQAPPLLQLEDMSGHELLSAQMPPGNSGSACRQPCPPSRGQTPLPGPKLDCLPDNEGGVAPSNRVHESGVAPSNRVHEVGVAPSCRVHK